MKTQEKEQIKKLISALEILGFEKRQDENFKPSFISRAICNPFKISYILQKDLENLKNVWKGEKVYKKDLEDLNKDIVSDKIREQFFKATNIEKFFKLYFDIKNDTEQNLFSNIINKFKISFFGEMNYKFKAYKGDKIAQIYANELENFKVLQNGSCMQGKDLEWFEIYTKCENLEICTLSIDNNIIARGLLWEDREKANSFYLDRIYISNEFDSDTMSKLQTDLYFKAIKRKQQKFINCANRTNILEHLRKDKTKNAKAIEILNDSTRCTPSNNFSINVKGGDFEYYPYADTFKNYEIIGNNSILHYEGANDVFLDCTEGGRPHEVCEACEERVSEDYAHYSDLEDCTYCEDCSTWLEDRETYTYYENAVEDTYRGVMILQDDIR